MAGQPGAVAGPSPWRCSPSVKGGAPCDDGCNDPPPLAVAATEREVSCPCGSDVMPPAISGPVKDSAGFADSVVPPIVMELLRCGDLTGSADCTTSSAECCLGIACHFGVTSTSHLIHLRPAGISARLETSVAPSSASAFISFTVEVLPPRLTAAAILCTPDSLRGPFWTGRAESWLLSLVSCAKFAFRTVPVRVRSACL